MNFALSLTENADRYPDRVALVCGEQRTTYAELNARVSDLARQLVNRGAGPGSVIGVLMWNCSEFVEVYYAAMRIGAVFLPLNYRMSADELSYELKHSECIILFYQNRFHETVETATTLGGAAPALITTDQPLADYVTAYPHLDHGAPFIPDAYADHNTPQRIMYTSGTTDRPRAVVITHGQVVFGALTRAADFTLTADDVGLVVGPLYHVAALDTFATTMLYLGGTVVICEKFEPELAASAIRDEHVTNCWMAPAMVSMVLDAIKDSTDRIDLRVLVMGGEKASAQMLTCLVDHFPGIGVYDAYGLTECEGIATVLPPAYALSKRGSVGLPARGREVRIVDDNDNDVGPDVTGEVIVRSPAVFSGYLHDPEATDAALRAGWLRTGDIGVMDTEGFLYIVDRKKDMIRSGGENIAASEVERVLREFEMISDAAVVAGAHEKWGQTPVAFLVVTTGSVDLCEVVEHCRARLANYKVPTRFVVVDTLPRTPSGKVLKRILRDQIEPQREIHPST